MLEDKREIWAVKKNELNRHNLGWKIIKFILEGTKKANKS